MSYLSLELFGIPRIVRNDATVHVSRRKVIALLAYLAVTQQKQSRDLLAFMLWPDHNQRRARGNLRRTLYVLNEALGPEWIEVEGDELALPVKPGLTVDVVQFRHLAAAPVVHKHSFPDLCDSCLHDLALAADIYSRDFLADFSLADSPEFETWQLMQRESLQRELSTVLEQLAHNYAKPERGRFDLAVDYARRRLSLDPLNEAAHRSLMNIYAHAGDRVSAMRQFDECARILDEELGVEPEQETRALLDEISADQVTVAGRSTSASASDAATHNLPLQATPFVGRTREMQQVATRLADPNCRLLSIVGSGGSGKTRLAIQAASMQANRFRDGVHFVDLLPVESPSMLASTIARSLDIPESGAADPQSHLHAYLQPKQMLLILDNLEHLLDAVDLLPEMLHAAPELKLLVTSRERLNLQEEWLEPLEGLSVPPGPPHGQPPSSPQYAPDLTAYDATLLFINRMRQLRPDFAPEPGNAYSHEDATAIAAICRLLEGMPLAIELAVGLTHVLTLQEILRETEQNLNVLNSTLHDVPARLRSMRAAFNHSWRLLSVDERRIMSQISVFRGGCMRDAAEQITGASLADLSALVGKSWLRMRGDGRYTMHELARQYCEDKLEEFSMQAGGDADVTLKAVRQRHCTYYGSYVNSMVGTVNRRPEALEEIMAEFNNLLAALHFSIETIQTAIAYDILMAIFFANDMMGWFHFCLQTMETLALLLESHLAEPSLVEPQRTDVALVLAAVRHTQHNQYSQLSMHNEASHCTALVQETVESMPPGRAKVYWGEYLRHIQIMDLLDTGRFGDGLRLAQESFVQFDEEHFDCYLYGTENGILNWKSELYNKLGTAYWMLGVYAAATDNFEKCIELADKMGERRFKGYEMAAYARLVRTLGDYERAEELARQALRLSEQCGDRVGAAYGQLALGKVLSAQGSADAARRHLSQCLSAGRHSGNLELVMQSLCELGRIDLSQQKTADARRRFEEALAAYESLGVEHQNSLTAVWLGQAWCALTEGDADKAQHLFRKAYSQQGAFAYEVQESILGMALVLAYQGDAALAANKLQEVITHPATAANTRHFAQSACDDIEHWLRHGDTAQDVSLSAETLKNYWRQAR